MHYLFMSAFLALNYPVALRTKGRDRCMQHVHVLDMDIQWRPYQFRATIRTDAFLAITGAVHHVLQCLTNRTDAWTCKRYLADRMFHVSPFMVPKMGVEPTHLSAQVFETCVSANSTTRAFLYCAYIIPRNTGGVNPPPDHLFRNAVRSILT